MTKLLEQVQRGIIAAPRRIMLYGVQGVGKSTFASMAEKPIFIQTEDGLNDIDCERFQLATTYADVVAALTALYTEKHEYKTIVIDSLDWLERLIWKDVCKSRGVRSIEDFGFGKGYTFAMTQWNEVLAGLTALQNKLGMTVILVAHSKIERFEDPENVGYDRYAPRLFKTAAATLQEWCTEVLFATYKVHTRKVDEQFGQAKHRGIGTGERIIHTSERPSHKAKNRLKNLPDEIPLDYRYYASAVTGEHPCPFIEAVLKTAEASTVQPKEGE